MRLSVCCCCTPVRDKTKHLFLKPTWGHRAQHPTPSKMYKHAYEKTYTYMYRQKRVRRQTDEMSLSVNWKCSMQRTSHSSDTPQRNRSVWVHLCTLLCSPQTACNPPTVSATGQTSRRELSWRPDESVATPQQHRTCSEITRVDLTSNKQIRCLNTHRINVACSERAQFFLTSPNTRSRIFQLLWVERYVIIVVINVRDFQVLEAPPTDGGVPGLGARVCTGLVFRYGSSPSAVRVRRWTSDGFTWRVELEGFRTHGRLRCVEKHQMVHRHLRTTQQLLSHLICSVCFHLFNKFLHFMRQFINKYYY